MRCSICNKKLKNNRSLSKHVYYQHNLKSKDYYDLYLKKENEAICLICKCQTNYKNISEGYHTYCSKKCQSNDPNVIKKRKYKVSGDNHWMKKSGRGNSSKGKTYEQLYGKKKANELKKILSSHFLKNCTGEGNPFFGKHHNPDTKEILKRVRSGKTYEEIFGVKKGKYLRTLRCKSRNKIFNKNESYSSLFYNLNYRKQILKEQKYFCPICFNILDNKIKNLHHINYIKKDNRRRNLIYLCVGCHATTNGNRKFWKAYLKKINREIIKNENVIKRLIINIEKQLSLEERQNILFRRTR